MFDTLPDLDFTLSQEEGCVPINLTLNNNNFIQDFNYSWILTDAESYTALADTSFVIEEEGIYNYSLQVQSNLDCSDISNMSFEAFQPEFFNSGLGSIQTCSPLNLNFDLAANMNQDFQDVSWEIDDFGIISESNQINYSINTAGNYDLELSGSYIDSNNCTTEFFESIPIEVLPNPEANFELNSDEFNVGTEYLFTNTSLNSTTQSWIFQSQTETFYSIEENPVVTFNDGPANYQITLYAQNEGCSDSLTLNVFVNNELFLYVPNSFTPNGDDINEIFTPIIKNNDPGLEYNFSIYNRWGQKIFESNKLGEGWNGASSINGDYYAQNGVYTWVLILNSSNLFSQLYTGTVTLLR
jgi:gliding motility-associated-like protein